MRFSNGRGSRDDHLISIAMDIRKILVEERAVPSRSA
jgi:hypothetical protein